MSARLSPQVPSRRRDPNCSGDTHAASPDCPEHEPRSWSPRSRPYRYLRQEPDSSPVGL